MSDDYDAVILTGGSGAIGSYLLKHLDALRGRRTYCLLRRPASLEKVRQAVGSKITDSFEPVFADLTSDEEMQNAARSIRAAERLAVIHCAADVSWTKGERLIEPLNLHGVRRVADLAIAISRERPSFVLLSTAFTSDTHQHRNAYEKTKLAAETLLLEEYADAINLAIIRCSLVVGGSRDGWISRFNGVYPLIRVISLGEVPCLVADRNYAVDTVPVDFVCQEIERCLVRLARKHESLRLVAASGDMAMGVSDLLDVTLERANSFRNGLGIGSLPPISVISNRQYKFLMTASKTWGMEQRFQKVDQISQVMAGYIAHGESGRSIEPLVLASRPPSPHSYMRFVVDHWLDRNREKIALGRESEWLRYGEAAE